ncbi:SLC13 family permease [Brevibacterium limosum]|uniref:SLC13 family permease n=1 Tax=Brevibacterium limosum TaxID=2697565 RepID=UPI0014223A40|nr:SLC13 family permease [Brevibacterium limosum]
MFSQLIALIVFVALFAIGAMRGVHIGILMIAGAAGSGLFLADMTLDEVIGGFPLSIMVLLVGVTYLFAIAQSNGTIDRLIDTALTKVGRRAVLIPLVFFILTAGVSAMGSALAGLVMAPVGMQVARRYRVDFALVGLAIGFGLGAGGFAPTSLFGIVTYGTAHDAGIELSPLLLFTVAMLTYLVLLAAAYAMFGRSLTSGRHSSHEGDSRGEAAVGSAGAAHAHEDSARRASRGTASATAVAFGEGASDEAIFVESGTGEDDAAPLPPYTPIQILTVVCMAGLVASVIGIAAFGLDPDIGLLSFAFSAVLALADPKTAGTSVSRIDWSTVLLVGGIVTYVGVLETMGAVDLLGDAARAIGSPLVAAFVLCMIGGLVSAFASTTGILAALVPLALPLIADGGVPGWALIIALGLCASVVDVSPFSSTGATVVATAPTHAKERLTRILVKFGMSMVVIGPLLLVGGLVVPAMLFG